MTSIKALEVSNLTKSYGSVLAINNLNLEIASGEIFGLLGPNGAGKTSLISILATLEEANSGTAKIFGYDVATQPEYTKKLLGVVPQEVVSHGFFDIQEILEFHSGYYGLRNNKEHIHYLLQKLSLWEHRQKRVKQLSGGMKRRLMIAKALVHKPKLLLLDEPTAGVDIELREVLWNFVRELRQDGLTILLTTHYLQEAEVLCDRIGVINKGELRCVKSTRDIIKELSQRDFYITLKSEKILNHTYLVSQVKNQLRFTAPATLQVGELLQSLRIAVDEIIDLQIKEGGLEEAMRQVLRKEPL